MDYVVMDHHLDEEEGVYRVLIGAPVEHAQPMLDTDGNALYAPGEPLLDDDGKPLEDADGSPLLKPGEPMMETVIEHVPLEDFVFAADDERWQGKDAEAVAQEQRQVIKDALAAREALAAERERAEQARAALPGVGEAL